MYSFLSQQIFLLYIERKTTAKALKSLVNCFNIEIISVELSQLYLVCIVLFSGLYNIKSPIGNFCV